MIDKPLGRRAMTARAYVTPVPGSGLPRPLTTTRARRLEGDRVLMRTRPPTATSGGGLDWPATSLTSPAVQPAPSPDVGQHFCLGSNPARPGVKLPCSRSCSAASSTEVLRAPSPAAVAVAGHRSR